MKRTSRLQATLGLLALATGATFLVAAQASAAPPNPDHKVTICHRTDSNTNPYVQETVDIRSSGYLKQGHNDHTGPIWNPTLKVQHIQWGDIIPPYTYQPEEGPLFVYAGLNWTTAGQAIYDNECKVPEQESPSPTPTPTSSPSCTPSETPSETPTPTPTPTRYTPPPSPTPTMTPSVTPTPSDSPSVEATVVATTQPPTSPPAQPVANTTTLPHTGPSLAAYLYGGLGLAAALFGVFLLWASRPKGQHE